MSSIYRYGGRKLGATGFYMTSNGFCSPEPAQPVGRNEVEPWLVCYKMCKICWAVRRLR